MKVRFLLDENLSPRLRPGLLQHDPAIDVLRVGTPGAPPQGTPRLRLLLRSIRQRRLVVGDNQSHSIGGRRQRVCC